MDNNIKLSIESGLKINSSNEPSHNIPSNVFGIFISLERSNFHKLDEWPNEIHGCLGYWNDRYENMNVSDIIYYIKQKSYDSTWNDSRSKYFINSIYTDLCAKYKIYYMLSPIIKINSELGILENGKTFNNDKYGLIVESDHNKATYLPHVFGKISWGKIKKSLITKARITNSNVHFFAYKCKMISATLLDYFIYPIQEWINNNYNDFIPYIYSKYNEITINKHENVRNIATIYDFLKLEKYGFILKIKTSIINNLNYYKNEFNLLNINNRQASAFLMISLYEINKNDIFIKKIYDFLLNELNKNLENIDKQFELYEILMAISIIDKNNIEQYYYNIIDEKSNGSSSIFRYNWIAKFIQVFLNDKQLLDKNDIEKIKYYIDKIIKYIDKYISNDKNNETNYLAVSFEGITALYHLLYNKLKDFDLKKIEEKIEQLIIKLNNIKNTYGLYPFMNGDSRLDITGHVLNGYYNLIPDKYRDYYKYLKYKQKYINIRKKNIFL